MTFTRLWPVFTSLLYLLNIAIAVYSSIMLISSKRDPVKTLSWVMVMILLPYIGIILYFSSAAISARTRCSPARERGISG